MQNNFRRNFGLLKNQAKFCYVWTDLDGDVLRKGILACTYIVIPYAENFYEICVTNNSASFLRRASCYKVVGYAFIQLFRSELRPLQILREELMGLKYIV